MKSLISIFAFAAATSRYRSVNSWSRMTINLPFSRLGIVMGDPIYVPREAGAPEFEIYQKIVEAALNDVTAKAYALADADMTRATPPSRAHAVASPCFTRILSFPLRHRGVVG